MFINTKWHDKIFFLNNEKISLVDGTLIKIFGKYQMESVILEEEDYIDDLFQLKNGLLLVNLKERMHFWNISTRKIVYSINIPFSVEKIMKFYELSSKNLLLINSSKYIIFVSTKTYQIQTLFLKEKETQIGIVDEKWLINIRNKEVHIIDLDTLIVKERQFFYHPLDILQINNNLFILFQLHENSNYGYVYYF